MHLFSHSDTAAAIPLSIEGTHTKPMTIRFVLMVNKQGQTRLAQYYETHKMDERCALESEVIRKCLTRTDTQVRAEPAGRIKTACKEPRIMSATY